MLFADLPRPKLYRSQLRLRGQRLSLSLPGFDGPVLKVYPLLSRCRVSLLGRAGASGALTRWQYLVRVPVSLLGGGSTALSILRFRPELSTPLPEETMRFSGGLHVDVDLTDLSAAPLGPGEYELRFSACIRLFLSA